MSMIKRNWVPAFVYIYLCCLLLILPLPWLIGWLLAILVHECGHYSMVKLCGGEIVSLTAVFGGLHMTAAPQTRLRCILCIAGGPLFGALPVLLRGLFPEFAICSLMLTIYNTIPVRPLDGGRILEQLLYCHKKALKILEVIVLGIILISCLCLSFCYKLGILPIVICAELVMKNREFACKRESLRVQ